MPLLAIAKRLKTVVENAEIEYLGSGDKLERELAKESSLYYKKIFSGKLRRYITLRSIFQNLFDLFKFVAGFCQTTIYFLKRKPNLVFSKGGYASLPAVLAAGLLGIPVIEHESDILMGLANRIALGFSSRVGVAFPEEAYSQKVREKSFYCGIPLSEEFGKANRSKAAAGDYLLVVGGSSGAHELNSILLKIAPKILEEIEIVHLTGRDDLERATEFKKTLPLSLQDKYRPIDFSNEMAQLILKSKLVISRAGATAIFEIAACGKSAIFVPLPKEVTDHQAINAEYLKARELADVFYQHDAPEELMRKIDRLLHTSKNSGLEKLYFPRSTDLICRVVGDEIEKQELINTRSVFLIGICGVSMKAIAALLTSIGKKVRGSDIKLGGHSAGNITADIDLVVYSSAAGRDSQAKEEHEEAEKLGIETIKRSKLIGLLMRGKTGVSIAGMHGKTTVASLVARLLEKKYPDTSYLIGADSTSANRTEKYSHGKYFVAEACEYDDSFLDFPTSLAVITNIEEEHLDYFKEGLPEIKRHFSVFINKIYPGGALVYCADGKNVFDVVRENISKLEEKRITLLSYGFKPSADFSISDYAVEGGAAKFTIKYAGDKYKFATRFTGKHMAQNVAASVAVASLCSITPAQSQGEIAKYKGAARRFAFVGEKRGVKIYDDYGHHPTEILATLSSLNEKFPKERKVVIFQPHQQNRFNNLYSGFADVFRKSKWDMLFILPVYRVAGRDEEEKYTAHGLVKDLKSDERTTYFVEDYSQTAKILSENTKPGDIVLTMGATDVWKVGEAFLKE